MNNVLQSTHPFISAGHLTKVYSADDFSLFCFLDLVYVGFNTTSGSSESRGLLLSKNDATAIMHNPSLFGVLFDMYYSTDNLPAHSLVFDDKLLALCATRGGCAKIKRDLKRRGYFDCTKAADNSPAKLDKVVEEHIVRIQLTKSKKQYLKRVKLFSILSAAFLLIAASLFLTKDIQNSFNPIKQSEPFARNEKEGVYVSTDIDFLTPFKETADCRYYLFGNTETREYGVLAFETYVSVDRLIEASQNPQKGHDPVRVYGYARPIPDFLQIQKEQESDSSQQEDFSVDGHTMTLPSGEEIWVPDTKLPESEVIEPIDTTSMVESDYSQEALEYFSQKGFNTESAYDLGSVYILADLEPEREQSWFNQALSVIGWVSFFALLIAWGFVIVNAFKYDMHLNTLKALNDRNFSNDDD